MIAILGRGKSLEKYREYSHLFNNICIVNSFNDEIDILGKKLFLNKKIIHIVGEGPNFLKKEMYKELDIKYVLCNRFSIKKFNSSSKSPVEIKPLPIQMQNRGYYPFSWTKILEYLDSGVEYKSLNRIIHKNHKKEITQNIKKSRSDRAWPTTGLLSIDYVSSMCDFKQIYLFGFDMYSENYMLKDNKKYQNESWDKSKMMRFHLKTIVEEFKDISFFNASKFKLDSINWRNI